MKTSELEQALHGATEWRSFCSMYQAEKTRLLLRNDGAATSGDLGLSFDSGQVIVTEEQIATLCRAALVGEIQLSDLQFSATAIVLSGFDFDNDETESAVHFLAAPTSEGLEGVREVIQKLRPR